MEGPQGKIRESQATTVHLGLLDRIALILFSVSTEKLTYVIHVGKFKKWPMQLQHGSVAGRSPREAPDQPSTHFQSLGRKGLRHLNIQPWGEPQTGEPGQRAVTVQCCEWGAPKPGRGCWAVASAASGLCYRGSPLRPDQVCQTQNVHCWKQVVSEPSFIL